MAVDPHNLVAAPDSSGNVVEFVIFALFVIASIGSTIVTKLRERKNKNAGTALVIPPPDQPALGRPVATPPAVDRPAPPDRPAMARPGRPAMARPGRSAMARPGRSGPSPADLSARRERAKAILLDAPAPLPAPAPRPDRSTSRQPTIAPHLQNPDQLGSLQREGEEAPSSGSTMSGIKPQTKRTPVAPARRPRITLSSETLRDAIIYAEILGAPRALRDEPRWSPFG